MKQYLEQESGALLDEDGRTIPAVLANRHYQGALAEVERGEAEIVVWEGSDRQADAEARAEQAGAEAYLRATDWYIIRNLESGVPVPPEVTSTRAQARTLASKGGPK